MVHCKKITLFGQFGPFLGICRNSWHLLRISQWQIMTNDVRFVHLHGSFMGGSASSGGFVTVDGFQKDFAAWAKNHPEGSNWHQLGRVFRWMPAWGSWIIQTLGKLQSFLEAHETHDPARVQQLDSNVRSTRTVWRYIHDHQKARLVLD